LAAEGADHPSRSSGSLAPARGEASEVGSQSGDPFVEHRVGLAEREPDEVPAELVIAATPTASGSIRHSSLSSVKPSGRMSTQTK
jgi:hypothetical protein